MSEENELKDSVKKVGRLVPIIKDAHGNIIDGFHRQKLDPKWSEEFSITLDHIHDPVQLLLARMNVNVCRRIVSVEEKTKWLRQLAEFTGWDAKRIAEESGRSYSWVLKYLSDEFKRDYQSPVSQDKIVHGVEISQEGVKSDVEAVGEIVEVDTKPSKPLVECECCRRQVFYAKYVTVDGILKTVCGLCKERLDKGEIEFPKLKVREKPKVVKPKETWEERKAHMAPQVSKMDEAMLVRLQQNLELREQGWRIIFQKHYCLAETISDVTLVKGDREILVYFDSPLHEKRRDKDESLREMARTRLGVETLPLDFKTDAVKEQELLEQQIMEAVKE